MSEFSIERVEQPKATRTTTEVYRNVVNAVTKEKDGWYKVTIPNKKTATIYQQLYKIMKGRKDIRLHKIKNEVFIEKLGVKK